MTVKKIEDLYNVIGEDVRKKLAECKTQDDIRRVLAEAGVEPLDDELLDAVAAGGMRAPLFPYVKHN